MSLALAGGPTGVVITAAQEVLDVAFATPPEPDDRPLPFYATGPCADDASAVDRLTKGSAAWPGAWTSPNHLVKNAAQIGAEGITFADTDIAHPEYVEAFFRLDAVCELALESGFDASAVAALRTELARGLNRGIYQTDDGLVCVASERPTRGQARAWLTGLATELGKRIGEHKFAELGQAVKAALDKPAPRRWSTTAIVAFALLVVASGYAAWRLA